MVVVSMNNAEQALSNGKLFDALEYPPHVRGIICSFVSSIVLTKNFSQRIIWLGREFALPDMIENSDYQMQGDI